MNKCKHHTVVPALAKVAHTDALVPERPALAPPQERIAAAPARTSNRAHNTAAAFLDMSGTRGPTVCKGVRVCVFCAYAIMWDGGGIRRL